MYCGIQVTFARLVETLMHMFQTSLLRVTQALCLLQWGALKDTNVLQLRPRVDSSLYETQYAEDTVSRWIFLFLLLFF